MRRLVQALAALIGLTALATGAARADDWATPTEPFHVIDNVYYVGTQGIGVYLIKTDAGLILIDSGPENATPIVLDNIKKLGFAPGDVKILLNTHAHVDHSGGLAALKKATGAKLEAMQGDVSALEGGFYLGSESDHQWDAPPVHVDQTLHDGDVVTLGHTSVKALLTPGHTRGCTSWSLPVQDNGRPLKALFFCSASVAANRLVGPPQYPGIVADYRKTFARTKRMHVDVPLSNHPEVFDLLAKRERAKADASTNPFVDPAAFARVMRDFEAAFKKALSDQTIALAARKAHGRDSPQP